MDAPSFSNLWRYAFVSMLISASAPTFGQNFMIGGNFGYASNRDDVTSLNEHFANTSTQAHADNDDDGRKAWSIYLNYPLWSSLSAQLGYVDLGSANTLLIGTETEVEPYIDSINGYPIDNVKGGFLASTYEINLNDTVDLIAKAGLHYWRADFVIQSHQTRLGVDAEGVDPMAGIALQLNMTHQLAVMMEWNIFTPDSHKFDLMALGLAWRFR